MTVVVLLTSLLFITANYGEDIGDLSNANFSELPLFHVNLTINNFVFVLRRHSKKKENETFSSRAPSCESFCGYGQFTAESGRPESKYFRSTVSRLTE